MAKIQIQPSPQNKNILRFGNKAVARNQIEVDKSVQNLISTRKLLTKEINELLYKLLGYTNEIEGDTNNLKNSNYPELPQKTIESVVESVVDEMYSEEQEESLKSNVDDRRLLIKKINEKVKERTKKVQSQERGDLIEKINNKSLDMEKSIDEFERKNTGINLDILEVQKFYYCKKCLVISSENRFKQSICSCGQSLNNSDDIGILTISKINDNIKNFIKNNTWLEYGVEQLFEDEGYNTECGWHLLGNSGIFHEIDVIAEKPKGEKIICECTISPLDITEISVFYTKLIDTGAFRGYIFTTATTSPEIIRFANSKNIIIIEAVLETNKEIIREKIKLSDKLFSISLGDNVV